MRDILQRAWRDTRNSLGLKVRTLVHYIAIPGLAVLLLWWVVGRKQAVDEVFVVLCYILIATLLFVFTFLLNLWLAPYKLMHERLDEIADAQHVPQAPDEEDNEETAFQELAPQIRDACDQLVHMSEAVDFLITKRHAVNALIADIGTRLMRLRVPIPETTASNAVETVVESWIAYLAILTPLADMGDIRNARSITFRDGVVRAPISPAAEGSEE